MPTSRRTGKNGLPVFLANELAAVKKEGSTAVVVLSVGNKLKIGATADPNRWARNVACATKAEVVALFIGWAPDAPMARRIKATVERTLEDRRIGQDLFDVPENLAMGALGRAIDGIGIQLRTTEAVLRSHTVLETRKRMGYYYYKVLMKQQMAAKRENRLLAAMSA